MRVRIGAVGDLHLGTESVGVLGPSLREASRRIDALLVAGDLTHVGDPDEARIVAAELAEADVPVVAVLGNHDLHCGCADEVTAILQDAGIVVLRGAAVELDVRGCRVGIAGTKGFGGGFIGACGSPFGEPEMKVLMGHTTAEAEALRAALADLDTEVRVVLLHYAPIEGTLAGERTEIFPFLGSYLLAEAIDATGADLVVHGHAHRGIEKGVTPGGAHVRNVAQPVIRQAYAVYEVDSCRGDEATDAAA
jgi:Icc-related predicted phosphoesterase